MADRTHCCCHLTCTAWSHAVTALPQVAVAKLYKEYDDSAWAHWAGASVRDLACIIRSGDPSWQLRELRTRTLALLAKQEEATKVGWGKAAWQQQRQQSISCVMPRCCA